MLGSQKSQVKDASKNKKRKLFSISYFEKQACSTTKNNLTRSQTSEILNILNHKVLEQIIRKQVYESDH